MSNRGGGYADLDPKAFAGMACRPGRGGPQRRFGVQIGRALGDDIRFCNAPESDRYGGGSFLTPSEADALAEKLMASARWARAQNALDHNAP